MLAHSVRELRASFARQCEVTTDRASEAAELGQQLAAAAENAQWWSERAHAHAKRLATATELLG
jgi:hypothetical protein